jgi:hypothetical protein
MEPPSRGNRLRTAFGQRGVVDLLEAIEEDLGELRRAGTLDEALHRWKTRRNALRSFTDAESLIAFLRDPDPSPRAAKDSALAAVCVEATHGDRAASTLLLWLMLPGLLRVRQRLAAWNALAREDLDAELVAGLWEAASAVGPGTTGVGARMVNRARRRALGAVRRAVNWAGRSAPLSTDISDDAIAPGSVALEDVLSDAARAGVISSADAVLLRTTRQTIGEVRERLGIKLAAAQQRRHRARLRLLDWLADPP